MKGSKRAKAAPLAARRAYPRLTLDDRRGIERGLDGGESMREIARRLGRPPSTVTREVKRNRVYLRPRGSRAGRFIAAASAALCGLLARSPGVCNGCRKRACGCSRTTKPTAPTAISSTRISAGRAGAWTRPRRAWP
ncbi:helix-turn-helix domain-containing protein [Collinsella ihumii]|uniref:helix-turn-helix domain-containing protein n=1 Tax=Collinsella ihumii TaxID=1720204 RepID=UPI003986930C